MMTAMATTIRIASRFCGPPGTANGGYVSGLVAQALPGARAVEVTLRAPTPLETDLFLTTLDARAELRSQEGALLVEALPIDGLELTLPPPVSFAEAERSSQRFVGFQHHPYPDCFVCGTDRRETSLVGLRLHPGAIDAAVRPSALAGVGIAANDEAAPRVVAAPFCPAVDLCDEGGQLRSEQVWAALDCPAWFGASSFLPDRPKILLGRLAVSLTRRPRAHERCVVTGFAIAREGRRFLCGSALHDESGNCLAYARSTWIEVKSA